MKKLLIMLPVAFAAVSCGGPKVVKGLDLANLDEKVAPGDSFYDYACGGWIAAHPLKPEYSRYGTFDELTERNAEQVKELIVAQAEMNGEMGSPSQKVGTLYKMAMDSVKLNADGAAPLKPVLAKIEAVKEKKEIAGVIAAMLMEGPNPLFNAYVYIDDMQSDRNIFQFSQGGFSMGDRDYYLDQDERTEGFRAKYREMIVKLFGLAGYDGQRAEKAAEAVQGIEKALAQAAYSREKLRDPMANYHKLTGKELEKLCPAIDWKAYFVALEIGEVPAEVLVGQPEALAEVSKQVGQRSLDELKDYLLWNSIRHASSFLSDEFVETTFDYYGRTLSGTPEMRPRWKRAVSVVGSSLSEVVGQLYVEKYFPAAAKERMLHLVENLRVALGERIANLEWMGPETKVKAKEKLDAIIVKIGYPDKWRDYSALVIQEDSYLANEMRSNVFESKYNFSRLGKPVDKTEWLMPPQMVNAYYNPGTNEICFPAGILQPPFFNMEADDAVNYGAIGVVIGHEMTHGFDDQGSQFDKDGNLASWWTPQDREMFDARTKALVEYFDNITVVDSLHANGKLTLGENIADQGGLQVSWQALQKALQEAPEADKLGGFTPAQRFFLSYANVWAGNIREEEIRNRTKIDPHSLGRWRVDGALPQVDAWYEAFNISSGDKMFIPMEQRVLIW